MRTGFGRALAFAAVLLAAPAQGASVDRYTSLWILGDSLSDPGNLFAEVGAPQSPPYFQGRFSNDLVWADHVAARFAANGVPVGNVAYGTARALPDGGVPDLPEQFFLTAQNSAGKLGRRPVAALWFGSNDLFGAIGRPGQKRVARQAANAVAAGTLALARIGITESIVFNLPDLGSAPAYKLFQPDLADDASKATRAFNRTLDKRIGELNAAGLKVREIDIHSAFNDVLANPGRYGILDTVNPCIVGASVCSPEQALVRAFFDAAHPNSVLHREIANLVEAEIAPVPLPAPAALLLAALALLAYQRRTRRPSKAPSPATTRIASTYQTA
jgi:outer membrane lipase/esterase